MWMLNQAIKYAEKGKPDRRLLEYYIMQNGCLVYVGDKVPSSTAEAEKGVDTTPQDRARTHEVDL